MSDFDANFEPIFCFGFITRKVCTIKRIPTHQWIMYYQFTTAAAAVYLNIDWKIPGDKIN